jgi:tetratricopeptide (TPR) repeat protein
MKGFSIKTLIKVGGLLLLLISLLPHFLATLQENIWAIGLLKATQDKSPLTLPNSNLAQKSQNAYLIGQALFSSGQAQAALPWLEASLTIDSRAGLSYLDLCIYAWQQGQLDTALQHCRAGHIPAEYWQQQGIFYERISNFDAALAAYWLAILLDPQHDLRVEEQFASLGKKYSRDPYHFIELVEPWLSEFPEASAQPYRLVGEYYWQVGNPGSAFQVLQDGYAHFPTSPDLLYHLAYYTYDHGRGDLRQAAIWFDLCIQQKPDYLLAISQRAAIAMKLQDWPAALEFYKRAVMLDSNQVDLWLDLGRSYQMLGNSEQAAFAYEKALFLDPFNIFAQEQLGQLR